MPRKPLIRNNIYPYHVTSRSNNKEWFQLPMESVWNIAKSSLLHAHFKFPVDIICFVLMSNHYHLLVRTPNSDLDKFMYEFNKEFSLQLREKTKRINKMFGGRYKWTLIKSHKYLANCYRYIYQNPLRANITNLCENYPYSTLFYKYKNKTFIVPLCDIYGFTEYYKLSWLNQIVDEDELTSIRNGLYRSVLERLVHPKTKYAL